LRFWLPNHEKQIIIGERETKLKNLKNDEDFRLNILTITLYIIIYLYIYFLCNEGTLVSRKLNCGSSI